MFVFSPRIGTSEVLPGTTGSGGEVISCFSLYSWPVWECSVFTGCELNEDFSFCYTIYVPGKRLRLTVSFPKFAFGTESYNASISKGLRFHSDYLFRLFFLKRNGMKGWKGREIKIANRRIRDGLHHMSIDILNDNLLTRRWIRHRLLRLPVVLRCRFVRSRVTSTARTSSTSGRVILMQTLLTTFLLVGLLLGTLFLVDELVALPLVAVEALDELFDRRDRVGTGIVAARAVLLLLVVGHLCLWEWVRGGELMERMK